MKIVSLARKTLTLFVVCSAVFAFGEAVAQAQSQNQAQTSPPDTSKGTVGIVLDGSYNIHNANFETLPGVPNCCPLFENGNGLGYEFGLFYDYDAWGASHIGVRAVVSSLAGKLIANEPITIAINGAAVQANDQYTIDSKFTLAALEPYYAYDFGGLRLTVGGSAGMILSPTYNQAETLTQPANQGVFTPENSRTRNVYSGTIPDAEKLRIGLIAGLSYPLPLNSSGSLHLIPEVFFDYGLTQMVTGLNWTVDALRAGVSIGYTPIYVSGPPPDVKPPAFQNSIAGCDPIMYDTVIVQDNNEYDLGLKNITYMSPDMTPAQYSVRYSGQPPYNCTANSIEIFVQHFDNIKGGHVIFTFADCANNVSIDTVCFASHQPSLEVGIKAYTIDNGIKDSTGLSVTVEEFYSTTQTPFLPFIFFGRDSASIPSRYHSITAGQTASFDIQKTDSTDNVRVYHDILNIIGKRMRENPRARITLTGCTSNEPEELGDSFLAQARANSVANYLKSVWSIPGSRITVQTRALPEKPSSLTQQDGKEENRRVEMAVSENAILAPITLADTTLSTNPPMMQFVPSVAAQAGVKFWDLYVTQPVMTLHHANGEGTQPQGWDWDLRSVAARIPRTEDTIEYGLTITDSAGQDATAIGTIPVKQTTISKKRLEHLADKVIERYTLVLFDFGSSKIDPQNQRAIDFIRQNITPGTKVIITGYADRTGEDTLNQHLTQDRANAVAKLLGASDYTATGVGKSKLLFDNNYPEGRFYSRTVNIVLLKSTNQ